VTFLRFAGPEKFVVQVNGVERTISRDDWDALPVRPLPADVTNDDGALRKN
jgi:hypothetical protein